jgi:hypothetical protein
MRPILGVPERGEVEPGVQRFWENIDSIRENDNFLAHLSYSSLRRRYQERGPRPVSDYIYGLISSGLGFFIMRLPCEDWSEPAAVPNAQATSEIAHSEQTRTLVTAQV